MTLVRHLRRAAPLAAALMLVAGPASPMPAMAQGMDEATTQHETTTHPAAGERWVAPEALHAAAALALTRAWGGQAGRIEIDAARPAPASVVVPPGATTLVARALGSEPRWHPRMSVWVDVMQAGRAVRSVLVPVDVRIHQRAWIALQDLPAGTRLAPEFFVEQEMDVAPSGQLAWQGEPAGPMLRAPVRAGAYLKAGQVGAPMAVARGEHVQLSYREGVLEILAAAQALQEGNPGQHVQIRVDVNKNPILARVVAPGKVELVK